ncbi:TlpA family protein disulfide reductase [Aquimarina brevivitae]|uniref:AhpC/TSA family protein n=1 Tax=Aquimarina brevivitae TaxID=323412 RepID=A0A4Q7PG73_9FLAO|nr:TlpA disulfide reductase family protein [Aquimarina brevivitae]RZS99147.1 AhpC/TSA family protein [Aquimarina brevivitae]
MKLYLKTTVVVLGLWLLCFLGYQVYAKMQYKQEVEAALKTIPDFSFETLEGKTFTQNNLDTDQPTVLIYFNSGCDYCQHEAQSIEQHIDAFKNVQLVFVSYETKEAIQQFSKTYKLNNYDNIILLSDTRDDFANRFDATSIPYLLIYDKDKKLIAKHKGQLRAESIIEMLNL